MRARRAAALAGVVFVACAVSALGVGPAYAGFSEHIVDYHSDITIERDGTIEVHETIVYDFGVVPKHGIFRIIPVRTSTSPKKGYDRVYPLTVVSVSGSEGTPAQYSVEEDGDNESIKIGDPDRTITGEHTYDIVYRVRGEMNAFADHDELVWNAVGVEWPVFDRQGVGHRARTRRHHQGRVATHGSARRDLRRATPRPVRVPQPTSRRRRSTPTRG